MHWYTWIFWGIGILIGLWIISYGFRFNAETHASKSVGDYAGGTDLSEGLLGCLFSLVFGLIIGVILKILPWWIVKILIILFGVAVVLGVAVAPWANS